MSVIALCIFAALFLIVFVLRSVVQHRRTGDSGLRAGVLAASPGSLEWWAGWLFVVAIVAAVAAPIADLAGLDPLVSTGWQSWLGVVLAVIGTALTFAAQMSMGSEWRIGVDAEEQTGLVTGGAFEIVRNPIFSALMMVGLGLTLMVVNPISLVGFVALVGTMELQVRFVEEPHLVRLHGASYADYCSRVGRFVPGVGTR